MADKARRSQVDLLTEILATLERVDARLAALARDEAPRTNTLGDLSAAYRRTRVATK